MKGQANSTESKVLLDGFWSHTCVAGAPLLAKAPIERGSTPVLAFQTALNQKIHLANGLEHSFHGDMTVDTLTDDKFNLLQISIFWYTFKIYFQIQPPLTNN